MFCPKCGANVPDNQAFCAACGNRMAPAAAPAAAPQKQPVTLDSLKATCKKDVKFIFRVAIVALALLSIILIFSKGMSFHYDDTEYNMVCEWDSFFKDCCDVSKALPITFQVISLVFVLGAAAAIVVPVFIPQLNKIKGYDLISAAAAILALLLFVIMVIIALATFDGGKYASAFPATASWFYIADLVAIIVLSFKMNKANNKQ